MSKVKALVVVSVVIVLGIFLTYTYSSPVTARNVLAEGTVNVPAESYQSILYVQNSDGVYLFQVETDGGIIQAFTYGENSTEVTWTNGTVLDIRDIPSYVAFDGSSGEFGYAWSGDQPHPRYLIFSNTDSYSKEVSYSICHSWTYNNYFGLMIGIALTALGLITGFFTLFRRKLKDFNKALENQE